MPIYEYECNKCHHRFEKKQAFDEEAVASCPKCDHRSRRLLSPSTIIYKGSGFYVTDNQHS
jgi:putative FmdB family regulatory protein